MKQHLYLSWLVLMSLVAPLRAATSINAANHFAYGANIGWIDWRGDGANGAVIGQAYCGGYIYSANCGWIHLGDGSPVNGFKYQNNAGNDFGVNHDGLGNLHGYAYGANIGWLTFTNRDATGTPYEGPKVNLFTGRLSGFVWSANCGWISLSNAQAHVQTDTIGFGPDTDGDGIPDAWELAKFGNLSTANATSDNDGDGFSDRSECVADTNPQDPNSFLRITHYAASPGGSPATMTWTSRPTRQYRIFGRSTIVGAEASLPLGIVLPDAGTTTTRNITDAGLTRFYHVHALVPLAP